MGVFSLRPYQASAKEEISALFQQNVKRVIFCSPTGSGKTVTFANMAREAVLNGFSVMVVVDRKELLQQAQDKLINYGLNPSLITSGRTGRTGSKSYIATVQTLARREAPPVDVLIIDEAHKQIFDKVVKLEAYRDAYIIGATATPYRTGRMTQLNDLYDQLIDTVTIQDLITDGFLVPAITYGAKVDTSNIKLKGYEYDLNELYKAFDKKTLYAGVVEKYKKFAEGTKALCFCINIAHSKKVADSFNTAGVSAVHLDGSTPKTERESILKAFSEGHFKVLCNVDVLTTGFDEWTVETVIVNRATKSLPLWLQMCGRGSRITPKEFKKVPGRLQKTHFNILDMGGNVFTLGFWEAERTYSLTHKTKTTVDAAPVKTCPEDQLDENKKNGCGALLPISATRCKFCSYVFPKPKKKEAEEAEFIQLQNEDYLPLELVGKSWGSMTIAELEKVRIAKSYRLGWVVKQIIMNKDLELIDYANFREFKNPAAWVRRMEEFYLTPRH